MNYRKSFLLMQRDILFDQYLDTLDKIGIWKLKINGENDFHKRQDIKELIQVFQDVKLNISKRLVYYDTAINAAEHIQDIYITSIQLT